MFFFTQIMIIKINIKNPHNTWFHVSIIQQIIDIYFTRKKRFGENEFKLRLFPVKKNSFISRLNILLARVAIISVDR